MTSPNSNVPSTSPLRPRALRRKDLSTSHASVTNSKQRSWSKLGCILSNAQLSQRHRAGRTVASITSPEDATRPLRHGYSSKTKSVVLIQAAVPRFHLSSPWLCSRGRPNAATLCNLIGPDWGAGWKEARLYRDLSRICGQRRALPRRGTTVAHPMPFISELSYQDAKVKYWIIIQEHREAV